ncbi:MAG: hypothetical protein LIR46_07845 [Bacteroidota bacterium]|nr:hypothetical protein [Bacteroidota bacterium]
MVYWLLDANIPREYDSAVCSSMEGEEEMTREEARKKAQIRVWCYMNKEDIDYYFDFYELTVLGKNGKKKTKPNRAEKKHALIEYLTDKMIKEDDSEE